MKNKKKAKADYSRLTRKLYLYMFIVFSAAVSLVVFLRLLTRGRVADGIVRIFQYALHIDYDTAVRIYQNAIRNNIEVFYIAAIVICFFILSRYLLARFLKYFNEIDDGINILIEGLDKGIELSPEMNPMEQKLNALKQTLEKREQDAKLAEQRKNDLVMYLAHDIKTPLTSVIGYLSLLDEAHDMPAEQKAKYVNITLDKANRLEQLIDEFFEITRYNLQTIILTKKNIDLYYMLAQLADEFYPQLSANGKQAVIHAPEDLTVYGDPDKLARVFNNILKNAEAYSEDNSVIDITGEISGGCVSVVVRNKGGIPKDKLALIFDKFFRLDNARSSGKGGAGLGLAIAKEIVALHGGQIHAESGGEYTAFTVELPVLHEQA